MKLRLMLGMLGVYFLAGCACCNTPSPSVFGSLPHQQIQKALQDNPLGEKENFKIVMLSKDSASSYHVVQIRGKERLHLHRWHGAKVLLWKGKGTLLLDGKSIALREGEEIQIPAGAPHAFTNQSADPAVAVVQFTPPFDGKDTQHLE